MFKRREQLYGKMGVEERYPFVKGYNIFMHLIKLKQQILRESYNPPTTRHFGFFKTYQTIKKYFLGERMKKDILTFVRECKCAK